MELGGLVVSEASRDRGIGSIITRTVVEHAHRVKEPWQIIAFSNKLSRVLFEKLGGTQIEDASTLPPEVWKVCHTCKFYDEALACNKTCCGRVYDITRINDEQ